MAVKYANLYKTKDAKFDEFYTRREDIDSELLHYVSVFIRRKSESR